jgi:hypothetical protein
MLRTNGDAIPNAAIRTPRLTIDSDRSRGRRDTAWTLLIAGTLFPTAALAANADPAEWIQWAVLGAIALLVIGVALRMILAARFPKGYGAWARSRREEFQERNAKWDAGDEDAKR